MTVTLPIHDGRAIEAHGRHEYNAGWGRYDHDRNDDKGRLADITTFTPGEVGENQ